MPKSTPPPYFELFNEIGIISQLSRTLFEAQLSHGMLVSHFSVLNHLIRVKDCQTPLALARAFQVPKTTMTHTLAGLEKNHFVSIRANPEDGRSKCVWINNKGRRFRDESMKKIGGDMQTMLATIDQDQVAAILPVLKDIRVYLDTHRN